MDYESGEATLGLAMLFAWEGVQSLKALLTKVGVDRAYPYAKQAYAKGALSSVVKRKS